MRHRTVESALQLDPMEYPQEIRAAAYLLVTYGQYMLWPHGSLHDLLKLAIEKLEVIFGVVANARGASVRPSIRSELSVLRERLRSLEGAD